MWRYVLVACFFLLCTSLTSAKNIQLTVAHWQFDTTIADNIDIEFQLTGNGLALAGHIAEIQLPSPINSLYDIKLYCERVAIEDKQINCPHGQLQFSHPELGTQHVRFSIWAVPQSNQFKVAINNISFAAGNFNVVINFNDQAWQATLKGNHVSISVINDLVAEHLEPQIQQQLTQWSMKGDVDVDIKADGINEHLTDVKVALDGQQITFADTSGRYASEGMGMAFTATLRNKPPLWLWQSQLTLQQGQGYVEPIFIDFSTHPLDIAAYGYWQADNKKLSVTEINVDHQGVLKGRGGLTLIDKKITTLSFTSQPTMASRLYQHWLQPFFLGTAADDLKLAGTLGIHYTQQQKDYQLTVVVNDLTINDVQQRFNLTGMTGQLAWTNAEKPLQTDVSWREAHLYAIPIGSSSIKARSSESSLQLLQPLLVPIFDGNLQINDLAMTFDADGNNWQFDGLITPISMASLSQTLGWPLFHGKLSGVIPKVSYVNKQIVVDGALMVKLFGGTSIVSDLRLNKPFDTLPELYANIDFTDLDLETLTQTFDFGRITGKLDGKIKQLRLSDWQPVYFNAEFATPDNDTSRKRISQQAVNNLSQLGGGAGGVLSRSFLRFFEDFSYQRLGLSCKLRNAICNIGGVGDTEQGYYIVKGGGLPPRINVIGHTRQVDWPELIARINAVSNTAGPVIK